MLYPVELQARYFTCEYCQEIDGQRAVLKYSSFCSRPLSEFRMVLIWRVKGPPPLVDFVWPESCNSKFRSLMLPARPPVKYFDTSQAGGYPVELQAQI
jgi:hypothetical protein